MKKIKFNLQMFADLDSLIEAHKDAFEGIDIKSQFSTISGKLADLGYDVLISNKEKAEFVPSHRLGEVVSQRETFKTQVNDLTNQLEALKKAAAGNEALQAQLQTMIDQNNALSADLEKTRVDAELMLEAKDAIDAKDLLLFVDRSKITTDKNGKTTGVKEEIDRLRKEKPHLFSKAPAKGGFDNGDTGGGNQGFNMNMAIRRAAGKVTNQF